MQATINYIAEELKHYYPEKEVKGIIRLIFDAACGLAYSDMVLKNFRPLKSTEKERIYKIVERLKKSEPIQYILGETEFYGLKFRVNPSVLIPRQETEELVDWSLKSGIKQGAIVLDIGTGSGCIAVSVKKNRSGWKVTATDISEEAVAIAKENAKLNSVEIELLISDINNPMELSDMMFDVIISNPPYVREGEKAAMGKNVLLYEPENALFVPDSDPLKFYRIIARFASKKLKQDGLLFLEINEALCNETIALLKTGFINIEYREDINGKPRMIKAQKK